MNKKIDLIMLANTANMSYFEMTRKALRTLQQPGFNWKIILVETNPNAAYVYAPIQTIIPNELFNYNRFLNHGCHYLRPDCDIVVFCNNDLIADTGWFNPIYAALEKGELDSASPKAPGWFCHDPYPPAGIIRGHRTSYEFCGWCWVITRPMLDLLSPFDENFVFESQDQDIAKRMQDLAIRHGLVLHSNVTHLLNQSHALIPEERKHEMFQSCHQKFKEKYGY